MTACALLAPLPRPCLPLLHTPLHPLRFSCHIPHPPHHTSTRLPLPFLAPPLQDTTCTFTPPLHSHPIPTHATSANHLFTVPTLGLSRYLFLHLLLLLLLLMIFLGWQEANSFLGPWSWTHTLLLLPLLCCIVVKYKRGERGKKKKGNG